MSKLLYAEKRLYQELSVSEKTVVFSDTDDHLVGVMLVYDNEEKAKKECGDNGYFVLEYDGQSEPQSTKQGRG